MRNQMLELQKFLQVNPLSSLDQFAIKATRHRKYPNLVLFKYHQKDSPMKEKIVQESRGIILDEAEDWEVVSRGFNKFFNYEEFLAAPIDWASAVIQEKLDGCFGRETKISCWDRTMISIGDIVNKGKRPILIGQNKKGKLVPCTIQGVANNGTKDRWRRIYFKRGNQLTHIQVTDNHQIVLNNQYLSANEAKEGDDLTSFEFIPSKEVIHTIESALLGDGSISPLSKSFVFTDSHVERHSEYTTKIKEWLGDFSIQSRKLISGYGSSIIQVVSKTSPYLGELRNKWYPNGVKIVPSNLDWMSDFTVAKWYMDDGSLAHNEKQQDRACFATNGFSKEDVEKLASQLAKMYGVSCTVYNSKGWSLRINATRKRTINKFWRAISPHIVECMRYKLPLEFRKTAYKDRQRGKTEFRPIKVKILKVTPLEISKKNFPGGRTGFDIQTSTKNYFAAGALVHNSYTGLYHYNNQWQVQTSGTPDASGEVGDTGVSFKDLFWQVFNELGYKLPTDDLIGCCFIFELMTKHNKVIVRHAENHLKLIGARSLCGTELPECPIWDRLSRAVWKSLNWEIVKSFPLINIKQIEMTFPDMDPFKQEGYVVVDKDFNRIKVKNPKYVAIHHLKEGNSLARLVTIVQNGETGEFTSYFPEWKTDFDNIQSQMEALMLGLETEYAAISHLSSQKEFALEAIKSRCSAALFCVRNGKAASIKDYIHSMAPEKIVEILGLKYVGKDEGNKDSTI